METIECQGLADLETTVKTLVDYSRGGKVWIFQGELGAGKTTLIQALAKYFGIEERVSSPSFSLINEYVNRNDEIFYHFDFYRLKNQEEAFEIGVDEYFESGHYCWIEWAEKIPGFIPEDFFHIKIEVLQSGVRILSLRNVKNGQSDG